MLLTYQSKFRINDTINNDTFVSFLDMYMDIENEVNLSSK